MDARLPLLLSLLAACGGEGGVEEAPRDAASLIRRAQEVAGTGDTPAAAALLEEALELHPGHAGAWHRLGEMRLLSGLPGALDALARAEELGLDSARFHQTRGEALEAEGEDYAAAVAFVAALEREPGRKEAWFRLAQVQRRLGQPLDADQSLAEFERLKQAEIRLAELEQAVAAAPDDPRLAAAAATARLELADFGGASAWVDRAFELDANCLEAHYVAARLANAQGDPDTASIHLDLFQAGRPTDPRPHMERALMALGRGDDHAAKHHAMAAVQTAQADPSVFVAYAEVLAALGELEEAIVACDEALLRDRENGPAQLLRQQLVDQERREGER